MDWLVELIGTLLHEIRGGLGAWVAGLAALLVLVAVVTVAVRVSW